MGQDDWRGLKAVTMGIEFHQLANVFPIMKGEDFEALVEDICNSGLRVPIVRFQGQILDGRNRYLACKEAGIEPVFEPYEGNDPVGFVMSMNIHRRHLNESQRAMAGARLATQSVGRPSNNAADLPIFTQTNAAQVLSTSARNIRNARVVLDHGIPELVEAVDSGDLAVSAAVEIARQDPEEQVKALQQPLPIRVDTNGNDEWYTPDEYIERARRVMGGIDLDPASCELAQRIVRADKFYTMEDDGLSYPWKGRVWLNPPYSRGMVDRFVEKLCDEYECGNVTEAVLLTNNFTDTQWFHMAYRRCDIMCFTSGRIRFYNENGVSTSPTNGHAFIYFGKNADKFREVFDPLGVIWGGEVPPFEYGTIRSKCSSSVARRSS